MIYEFRDVFSQALKHWSIWNLLKLLFFWPFISKKKNQPEARSFVARSKWDEVKINEFHEEYKSFGRKGIVAITRSYATQTHTITNLPNIRNQDFELHSSWQNKCLSHLLSKYFIFQVFFFRSWIRLVAPGTSKSLSNFLNSRCGHHKFYFKSYKRGYLCFHSACQTYMVI